MLTKTCALFALREQIFAKIRNSVVLYFFTPSDVSPKAEKMATAAWRSPHFEILARYRRRCARGLAC